MLDNSVKILAWLGGEASPPPPSPASAADLSNIPTFTNIYPSKSSPTQLVNQTLGSPSPLVNLTLGSPSALVNQTLVLPGALQCEKVDARFHSKTIVKMDMGTASERPDWHRGPKPWFTKAVSETNSWLTKPAGEPNS